MSTSKKTAAVALDTRARQVAFGLALSFASFVLLAQVMRAFFG